MNKRSVWLLILTTVAVLAACAALAQQADDEAVTLAYKWQAGDRFSYAITTHTKGKISLVQGQGTGQALDLDMTATLTMFSDVLEVSDDGSARVKVTFGMITTEMVTPQGQRMIVHMDPATGEVTVQGPGGQQQNVQQKLPDAIKGVLAKGFVITISDKGEIKEVEGLEKLQAALQKIAGPQATTMKLNQMVSWLEPRLPDKPVKPGDEWQAQIPWMFGAAGQKAPENLVMKLRYAGKSKINGVECAKVQASMEVSGLDMTVEPGTVSPMGQEVRGMSIRMYLTYYLDLQSGHVVRASGKMAQSGTVRQYGTIEVNGQEHRLDVTVQLDNLATDLEIEAKKE